MKTYTRFIFGINLDIVDLVENVDINLKEYLIAPLRSITDKKLKNSKGKSLLS